jgi:DNA replication and repair protein RecF
VYDAESPTAAQLEARLSRDLERGTTGLGPHLDDVLIASGDRDLRQFGSQGEQRLAVLSLLLAEAELLPTPPLLLLDDVLSELDLGRREVLARRLAGMGQTMITATHRSALPTEPSQVVEVEHGSARDGSARS